MQGKDLLIVDLEKKQEKNIALYQSMVEYQRLRDEIKEFQSKEKELKDKIKECGYKQIIFKSNDNVQTMSIKNIETKRTKLDEVELYKILNERLTSFFDIESRRVGKALHELIVSAIRDAHTTTIVNSVRIDFKNGE